MLKLGIAVQCDIIKDSGADYCRAALAHAKQHISVQDKYMDNQASQIVELEQQVRAEREVSECRLEELLHLKKVRFSKSKNELNNNS